MLPRVAASAAVLLLTGCGYIGDPLPPLANVPKSVDDLAAIQRGSRLIAHFTVPVKTTEAFNIPRPITLDLRAGPAGEHFVADEWASTAKHIPAPDITGPLATYEIPAGEWANKEVVVAVRVTSANGKQSAWSNFAIVPVVPAPPKPEAVRPQATAEGVRLTWRANAKAFRVLRKTATEDYTLAANTTAPEWVDKDIEYGKRYDYLVQSLEKIGEKTAESDLSTEASITPEDRFAPAVPAGLRVDAAPASIELTWRPNTEPDLAGYRIYRASGDGPLEKIADVAQVPAYSDRGLEHGKTYRYALTAFDRSGNESVQCPPAPVSW